MWKQLKNMLACFQFDEQVFPGVGVGKEDGP